MNPIEFAHRFIDDLLRLPLMFKLVVLYGVGATIWQWWKARQQTEVIAASASWPVYRARVVWAQVSDLKREGRHGPTYWEGLLTYSYTVPGYELEVGEHRKRFDDEEEADDWARALRDTFVDVRVDPANVKHSVWQEAPILTAPSAAMPVLDGSRLQGMEGWATRDVLAAVIFCVSAAGAFFAVWIQLSCLIGKPLITAEANTGLFFAMHAGAIACGVAGGLIAQPGKWSRSAWQKSLKSGSTGIAIKVLGFYTTAVFLYGWVRMASGDGDSRYFVPLIFSAGWLIFYVSAASGTLQAMQRRGHEGS